MIGVCFTPKSSRDSGPEAHSAAAQQSLFSNRLLIDRPARKLFSWTRMIRGAAQPVSPDRTRP
jgi:hypothetical protein